MTLATIALELIGGLAMFMHGMELTSDGIQRAAGDRLQRAVNFMTRNRVMAVLTGTILTILIQSSSATSVMVVSFVNAGLLSLVQAIGVIMGANIGTTLTGWIIAVVGVGKFSVAALAVPIFGLGFFMSLMKKRSDAFRSYGKVFMGFAMIFLGLGFIAGAIPKPSGDVLYFLANFSNLGFLSVIIAVLVGAAFTILVNASSATLAIVIALAAEGVIDFRMAAALTLGANIGTTFDAFLASLATNVNGRRAGYAHIFFNIFGTLWVIAVFDPFLRFVDFVTPGEIGPATLGIHIAMLHTLFNACNTLVLLPFVNQYAAIMRRIFPDKPGSEDRALVYHPQPALPTPELSIVHARKEISDMSLVARDMFLRARAGLAAIPANMEAELEWFAAREGYADSMQVELTRYLLEINRQDVNARTEENLGQLMRMVDDLENITDCCLSLAYLIERQGKKRLAFGKKEATGLVPYTALVEEFLGFIVANIGRHLSPEQLALAEDYENRVDAMRKDLKKRARKRLKEGGEVKAELLFLDIIRQIEKIGDHAFAVAAALKALK